jgi:CRISPR-associated protein Cas8c/Csp2
MIALHPYIKYAQALLMTENGFSDSEQITKNLIAFEIEKGLETFRIQPAKMFIGKETVEFIYIKSEKGDIPNGVFLAPNIITTDKLAKNIWSEGHNLIEELKASNSNKIGDLKMSIAPTSGEYLSFSETIGRGKPKASLIEQGLNAVTTLTINKPCLQYRIDKKGRPELYNTCIIPDLSIGELIDFIQFFKQMMKSRTSSDLMFGGVLAKKTGKGENEKITYEPKRPMIFKGNFPNPPRSSALGSVALLGAIGEFAKDAKYSEQAKRVLDSLKDTTLYLIKYGGASSYTYNHYVIDLAKESKLKSIIDSLYYSKLYNQDRRSSQNSEFQKFDLFTSRFLQMFNHSAFKDFLAFRAEYPNPVKILFNTYFIKMEKIDPKIVSSARILGKWLNMVAYFTAKSEIKEGSSNYWEELRKMKSKVLVELESSTFSAKSGDALIAQAVTRAGRLSGMDAPEGASLFMEKTMSGELPIENAKNLLIAFSRLINKVEKTENPKKEGSDDEIDDSEDLNLSNE